MVEWLAGNRIRGTSTERTTTCGFNPVTAVSGGWKELGRTSNSSLPDVTSLADKRYLMFLNFQESNASRPVPALTLNGDTGSNYARRGSYAGGSDYTNTGKTLISFSNQPSTCDTVPYFTVGYIANLSSKEKLSIYDNTYSEGGTGASNAPQRVETVGKWINTSDAVDQLSIVSSAGDSFNTNGELVVLGWDPDDTHTDNFWEPLADITLGSDASEISSGTITAKKYLWVQVYFQNASSSDDILVRFNNDTGSNYAHRHSMNYCSDSTATSQTSIKLVDRNSAADLGRFANFFAINNSANEKLLIGHGLEEETSGAGNHPTSSECVAKWSNTSSQITEIDCFTNSGNIRSGARLIVWGSD
jgi:hypothetical protein